MISTLSALCSRPASAITSASLRARSSASVCEVGFSGLRGFAALGGLPGFAALIGLIGAVIAAFRLAGISVERSALLALSRLAGLLGLLVSLLLPLPALRLL